MGEIITEIELEEIVGDKVDPTTIRLLWNAMGRAARTN